jgi:hypothetical protein
VLYINGLDGTGEGEVTLNQQAWGDDLTLANDFLRVLAAKKCVYLPALCCL